MYESYFVNVNTGELYRSGSPKNDKCNVYYPYVNVEGWSKINYEMYVLLNTCHGHGFVKGVESHL